MRTILLFLSLFMAFNPLRAGQIVVYNQVWHGTAMAGYTEARNGKGYILLDVANHKLTRISTGVIFYSKIYIVESFNAPIISEPGSGINTTAMVVNGAEFITQYGTSTGSTFFMKGKEVLVTIGPSQQMQLPKSITGIFKRTVSSSVYDHVDEDSFSGVFNASVTNDTNGNSRTLDAEVILLTNSLKAAGYHEGSR